MYKNTTTLRSKVSGIYQSLINDDMLNSKLPIERFAPCLNCHKCYNNKQLVNNGKCCNYHPTQPNFIVGSILIDARSAYAHEILNQKLSDHQLTPWGIFEPFNFSTSDRDICPYYDHGQCSVWPHRNEQCITYHCSSVGGSSGRTFWRHLYSLLTLIDTKVALYCMNELGISCGPIQLDWIYFSKTNKKDLAEITDEQYRHMWGTYWGNELDYYIQCYELVKQLSIDQIGQWLGVEGETIYEVLHQDLSLFQAEVSPEYLNISDITYQETHHDLMFDIILSTGQVITVSSIQKDILALFNGAIPTSALIFQSKVLRQDLTKVVSQLYHHGLMSEMQTSNSSNN